MFSLKGCMLNDWFCWVRMLFLNLHNNLRDLGFEMLSTEDSFLVCLGTVNPQEVLRSY